MPVFPRLIFLVVLGAASGSAGFILEHYWSFLIVLFPFAEEGLAFGCLQNSWTLLLFVLTNVNNFLSTGILSSLIFCRRIYIFPGLCMHVSLFHCLQNLQFFLIWGVNAENGNIVLLNRILLRIVAGPLIALQWSVGFANSHRLNFSHELLMIISVCLHLTSFCGLFLKFLLCNNFCI